MPGKNINWNLSCEKIHMSFETDVPCWNSPSCKEHANRKYIFRIFYYFASIYMFVANQLKTRITTGHTFKPLGSFS